MRIPCAIGLWCALGLAALAADGNRLTYLDAADPYYVGRGFPKLTTPQWVGEEGVEAVVVLAIDDLRAYPKWETYLRPIIERLKQIDGRAPISIMACDVDPAEPHLQAWLAEGLSIEVHTVDHPCPLLAGGDLAKAASTVDRCIDRMSQIPGNRPVAFRTPCCDSQNTISPRTYAEILSRPTAQGHFLQLDSSVFCLLTAADPELPRPLVLDEQGRERFRRYVQFPAYALYVEDYPYPYQLDRLLWQFPCIVPSDWQAQNLQQPANPATLDDWKRALDAVVAKRGAFDLVFHPYDWMKAEQVVELVDYAVRTYGRRVRFLNFREALERLNRHLLAGHPLRDSVGGDGGVRLIDLDDDGYLDVVWAGAAGSGSRLWQPESQSWRSVDWPLPRPAAGQPPLAAADLRWGVFRAGGAASCYYCTGERRGAWTFAAGQWHQDQPLAQLRLGRGFARTRIEPATPAADGPRAVDAGLRFRDLDRDGVCEAVVGGAGQQAVLRWSVERSRWEPLDFALPAGTYFVDAQGRDAGLRLVDVDDDGYDDVLFSNEDRWSLDLFASIEAGWSRRVLAGKRGNSGGIPMISRAGTSNGAWFFGRELFVQNEDTNRLPGLVERRSFNELLGELPPEGRSPAAALASLRPRPGFAVELVAAEPDVVDPIALAFGPDGKLWVVEYGDYPTGADGQPGGRIRYLEDTDGDGRLDRSVLFLDRLSFATGVTPWRQGVLITCAPDILYAEDTDGDGRADRVEVLFTGFGEGNPQHRLNGLRWGLDGWLYGANGDSGGTIRAAGSDDELELGARDFRLRPDQRQLDLAAGTTQFGRHRDDWDNWFGTNNAFPLWHFVLPDHYLRRNPHVPTLDARVYLTAQPAFAQVFPRSRTLARFNDLHTANRFTSACSGHIYRDDLFGPGFAGNAFICEPVHNLVHREVLAADGVTYTSGRAADERDSEFLASTDNWFRPTMAIAGPDGALWIADMYRAVIEHPEWIPPETQKRLDLWAGHDRGRIYRVAPLGSQRRPIRRLDRLSTTELVAALDSPSGAERDLVQQLLTWRGDAAAVPPLESLVRTCCRPAARVQALCTLDTMQRLDDATLLAALADEHPGVRRHAVRLAEDRLDRSPPLVAAVLGQLDQTDPQLVLQLAFSLGQWHDPASGAALGRLARRWHTDRFVKAAILSSVTPENLDGLLAAVLQDAGDGPPPLVEDLVGMALHSEHALARTIDAIARPAPTGDYAPWQFAAGASLWDELDRRQLALADLPVGERRAALAGLAARARQQLAAPDVPDDQRVRAVALVGRDRSQLEPDLDLLVGLLVPQTDPAVQLAAVDAIAQTRAERAPGLLLAGWAQHSPAVRGRVLDRLLARGAWAEELVAQLASGAVPARDLDAARRVQLARLVGPQSRARLERLFDTAGSSDRQAVIERYRAALDLAGDPQRGAELFAKHCAACHQLRGVGHAVGPDLAALADYSSQSLLLAMLDPNRAVEARYLDYIAVGDDGRVHNGILAAEVGNSITLVGAEGKRQVLLRGQLESLQSSGRSLMPEGLERDLAPADVADIMAHLRGAGPPRKELPLSKPLVVEAVNDRSLHLLATNCEVYGDTLIVEERFLNLGFWQSDNDRAVWTFSPPAAGRYRVQIDYACHDSAAGNKLRIDCGSGTLIFDVATTGSWEAYRQADAGTLQIAAGRQQLVARPGGPISGALLDLKRIRLVPVK